MMPLKWNQEIMQPANIVSRGPVDQVGCYKIKPGRYAWLITVFLCRWRCWLIYNSHKLYGFNTQHPDYGSNPSHPDCGLNTQHPDYGFNTQHPEYGFNTQHPYYGFNNQHPEYGCTPDYGCDTQHTSSWFLYSTPHIMVHIVNSPRL